MTVRKRFPRVQVGIISIVLVICAYALSRHNANVLSAKDKPPLVTTGGEAIVLDFNTPTPSPTPTPTPTNTATPAPSPTPSPTPYPVSQADLEQWFTEYANHYSVDRSMLWQIAACETKFRSNANNWIYGGIFQFSPNTWRANRQLMGMDANPALRFNPEEAIRTAAFLLSTRGPGAWPNCSKR